MNPCRDCHARPGQPHTDGCDVARCTVCGERRITCRHEGSEVGWGQVYTPDAPQDELDEMLASLGTPDDPDKFETQAVLGDICRRAWTNYHQENPGVVEGATGRERVLFAAGISAGIAAALDFAVEMDE
jgi:hypothetical protein